MKSRLCVFYFLASYASACGVYAMEHAVLGDRVFAAPLRMFLYHHQHPYQYIAVACVCFAGLAAPATGRIARRTGWRRTAGIWAVLLGSLGVACVPGGVLWSIHDMQAGFFPAGARFWWALEWGAVAGLQVGWVILACSIPYNLIGLAVGYRIMAAGVRRAAGQAG